MRNRLFSSATIAMVLVSTAALAAPSSSTRDADSPGVHASEAGADGSYFAARGVGSSIVLVPWARYAIPRSNVSLDVDVPLTLATGWFALGNPDLGADVDLPLTRWASMRAGVHAHLPGASIRESPATGFALSLATLSRGFIDVDHWAPSYVPITLPLELELQPARGLFVRALADTQFFLPIIDNPAIPSLGVLVALERGRIEVEGRSRWGIGAGLDVDVVSALTTTSFLGDHPVQVSVEPYLQFANAALFARAGVLVPLSEPLGIFGSIATSSPVAPVTTFTARFGVRID